jgi:hypothetical protein
MEIYMLNRYWDDAKTQYKIYNTINLLQKKKRKYTNDFGAYIKEIG